MTLEEAIKHCEYVAEKYCEVVDDEFLQQLAEWLRELKTYKDQQLRPKARLIRKTGKDWNDYYECSNCQACHELISSLSDNYCFKCGAKIEKRESIDDTVLDSNTDQFQF